ncbi:TetR/AcrR family transcriptional regulator [Dactylosporangium sp. CA-092794]|uniref:TetR/AcrR family transcriptional regulator n=1 Tax=Dactylosporangium sp. CA-092794 TaxID=3239929 RepID=UPI003D911110
MPRGGLDPAAVVTAAADLADEVGFAGLTMGLVAGRIGVRTPSLYKHIDSLDALKRGISVRAKRELGGTLARAAVGRSGPEAFRAFADAYRRWVLDHPGRYAATARVPAAGDEEDRRAGDDALQVLLDVSAGFGLRGADAIDAARGVRSAMHGFVSLEAAGAFGHLGETARSYRCLVDALITALHTYHSTPSGEPT